MSTKKPRAARPGRHTERPDPVLLHLLRRSFETGQQKAALFALRHCARTRIPMPDWLAEIVSKAFASLEKGRPDDLLGLGNEKILAKWRKSNMEARNVAIREEFAEVTNGTEGTEHLRYLTKQKIMELLAETHHLSRKAIEKILYTPKSPTFKTKK